MEDAIRFNKNTITIPFHRIGIGDVDLAATLDNMSKVTGVKYYRSTKAAWDAAKRREAKKAVA